MRQACQTALPLKPPEDVHSPTTWQHNTHMCGEAKCMTKVRGFPSIYSLFPLAYTLHRCMMVIMLVLASNSKLLHTLAVHLLCLTFACPFILFHRPR
jgi:hypothetical protein